MDTADLVGQERAGAQSPEVSQRSRWRAVIALLVAMLFVGIALGQLQGLLAGMHLSGRPSASIGGLNHLLHLGADTSKTAGTINVWHEYATATAEQRVQTADPYRVVWWSVAVDSLLFAPLYVATLFAFLALARTQLSDWTDETIGGSRLARRLARSELDADHAFRSYRRIATAGIALALLGGAADEIENVSNLLLVHAGWSSTANDSSAWFHTLAWALWLAGWAKWLFDLAAVATAIVLGWVLLAGRPTQAAGTPNRLRQRLYLVRLHIGVVLVVVLALFAHEQMPDIVRRWTPVQLALDLLLAFSLALAVWVTGRRLLIRGPFQPNWAPARRRLVGGTLVAAVVAGAAVQVVMHFVVTGAYRAGWGLVVPAGILLVFAVMGLVLPQEPVPSSALPGDSSLAGNSESSGIPATVDEHPALPRLLASLLIVGIAMGILHASFGYAVYERAWSWWAVALVAAACAGAALGRLVRRGEPLLWSATAVIACLIVLWRAERGELNPAVLVAVAGLLLLAGFRLFDALARMWPTRERLSRPLLLAGCLAVGILYAVAVAFPWWTGEKFSAIGVLLFFFAVVGLIGTAVIWLTPALPVPRALRVLHIRRFPIFTLFVVWFVAAGLLDKGGYHNVRIEKASAPATPVTLGETFTCWLGKNGLEQNRCSSAAPAQPTKGAVPLVLVATTGGGIRAAYWTDLVLTCAFEAPPAGSCASGKLDSGFARSDSIFAASGISGGSLGLASYAAYLTDKKTAEAANEQAPQFDWIDQRLDRDALSASGAWWLLVEIPRVFLQFRSPTDRASVLERGWERAWPNGELSSGLFALWRDHPEAPLLLLNGTSADDGCRFETSVLDGNVETTDGVPVGCRSAEPFDDLTPADPTQAPPLDQTRIAARSVLPATRDLVDFLCGDKVDVRLSTAALLSSRFPFVNPSGRIERRCTIPGARRPVAFVVDGGYLDTSGASPIVEMMPKLNALITGWNGAHAGRCIVPLMIQIDNGFSSSAARPPSRPAELLVPLKTSFATRGAREAEGRVGAALQFTSQTAGASAGNRYARFVNQAHPGPHAPLGWTQSHFSERELTGQLAQDANRRALAEVRNWLRPGALSCP